MAVDRSNITVDTDALTVALGLGTSYDSLSDMDKARALVGLLEKLRLEHNVRGQMVIDKKLLLAEFRAEQLTRWNPQLEVVGQMLAAVRRRLPIIKPDAEIEETWYRIHKPEVLASLDAQALSALDSNDVIAGTSDLTSAPDPYQDFENDYTKVDGGDDLSASTDTITITSMGQTVDDYFHRDFGVGHFTDFTGAAAHDLRTQIDNYDYLSSGSLYAVSNVVEDVYYWDTNNSQCIHLNWQSAAESNAYMRIREEEGADSDSYTVGAGGFGTTYDHKIDKNGTTITWKLYSETDPRFTNLLNTASITLGTDRSYRYHLAPISYNSGTSGRSISGVTKYHDLHDSLAGSVAWGHDTSVLEENTADLSTWSGTASIVGSGDGESIALSSGEYATSPVVDLGAGTARVRLNKYGHGIAPSSVQYKTGTTEANCEADTWHNVTMWDAFSGTFSCDGYAQVKVAF